MKTKRKLPTYEEFDPEFPYVTAGLAFQEKTEEATQRMRERNRVKTGHFLKFLQDNGLTRRIFLPDPLAVPIGFELTMKDVTPEALVLWRTGYCKWLDRFDRNPDADPSDVRILEKELAKIRAKSGSEEQINTAEPKKKPARPPSTKKRVAKRSTLISEPTEFVKYDDASWHYEGKFPEDLPNEAGATHTGMFVAWALLSGLAAEDHIKAFSGELSQLRSRKISPGAYFIKTCDEKFTSDELSNEGNTFARFYFDLQAGKYLQDYERLLAEGLPSTYHVPDTWDSFDKLKPTLDQRFLEWQRDY